MSAASPDRPSASAPPGAAGSLLVWFRRDLRLHDHCALHRALAGGGRVHCVFVFDTTILVPLIASGGVGDAVGVGGTADRPGRRLVIDRRVDFIWQSVAALDQALCDLGGGLHVLHGDPVRLIPQLAQDLQVAGVYTNHDDEPAALARDRQVASALQSDGRSWRSFKDHVIFERSEILTGGGTPYGVFTPYLRAWLARLRPADVAGHAFAPGPGQLAPAAPPHEGPGQAKAARPGEGKGRGAAVLPSLATLGFAPAGLDLLKIQAAEAGGQALLDDFAGRIDRYGEARDFPARKGPSYLSVHLRFGTVSIRAAARLALSRLEVMQDLAASRGHPDDLPSVFKNPQAAGAASWLAELVWRDFYHMVLHHAPQVVDHSYKPEFDRIEWARAPALFAAWCEGRTGYPLVDAAIAQIRHSGYMHNRLRMVVASFLTKDLGIDWRLGEQWFARHLNDYDLAANNGGWQWAASTGCDAQPYFRIFNPVTQSRRFDPQGRFIRRYLPQLAGFDDDRIHAPWLAGPLQQQAAGCRIGIDYPAPVVDHDLARKATLARYAVVRQ